MLVSGAIAEKASRLVSPDEPISLRRRARFVSRGGEKLDGALQRLSLSAAGKLCLDAGSSTGGFTDCLLQHGAAGVIAVDVGHGQLDATLRDDPRVHVLEGRNARDLEPADVTAPADLVTADLSFISLTRVAPALVAVAQPDADFVFLVKPQFEAGAKAVPRGGVIRDPAVHAQVLRRVVDNLAELGLAALAVVPSPLRGAQGNAEFFLHLRRGATASVGSGEVDAAVAEANAGGSAC